VPRPVVHDLFEERQLVVEGEARTPDTSVGESSFEELAVIVPFHDSPPVRVQRVEQVVVDMVRTQFCQLLVKKTVHVRRRFHHPRGKLGREEDLLAISAFERPADHGFALSSVIRVRRINVVHAPVDSGMQHRRRARLVDLSFGIERKAHTAKTKNGNLIPCLGHCTIEHIQYNLLRISPRLREVPARKTGAPSFRISYIIA